MQYTPEYHLRSRGLRVTAPRLAVLEALTDHRHVPADAIARAARQHAGTVSTQGIYNVLADLVSAGLVHRIEPAGSAALYELSDRGLHHHLICRECGHVRDLECDHDTTDCLQPPQSYGFADLEAEIVFWGTCPACQARNA